MASPRPSRELISTRRLEAYTDGVFAIAATLLVLDLSIDSFGSLSTDAQLWTALSSLSNNFLSFVISFLLLCLLWGVHTRQFEHVARVDSVVAGLNALRLLAVVLIPFTTSINGRYSDLWLGRMLMPANFFLVVLMGALQWFYVTSGNRGLLHEITPARIRATRGANISATVLAAIVCVLSPFIGPWAFMVFALAPPLDRLAARAVSRRIP